MFIYPDIEASEYGVRSKAIRPSFEAHRFVTISIMVLMLALAGFVNAHAAARAKEAVSPSTPGEVVYPTSLFDDGKAHHFQFKTNDGVTIRYFIIRSSDGVIRAAFDTCVVCWREGKGYVQKDDSMICRNCGRRFKSTKINEMTGGCNPAPLARKTENGKVIIKVESLLEGKPVFAFAGGR